jgi:predicted nucleic acid-binding protein
LRVVLDSNVFISVLISPGSPPDGIQRAWRKKRFVLVTSDEQLTELRRASRYIASDPDDNYLLAMADAGEADFLVTGDARRLLRLRKVGRTRILAPTPFLKLVKG